MALAIKPRLLILDEPSAGLSPGAVDDMYRILGYVRDKMNISILLIEQNVNKAIAFSDRCVLLEQGRIAHTITNPNINEIECLMFKKVEVMRKVCLLLSVILLLFVSCKEKKW